MISAGIHFL